MILQNIYDHRFDFWMILAVLGIFRQSMDLNNNLHLK